MFKPLLATVFVALLSLATAPAIWAQEIATLALRSGERPSGELLDLNGSGFVLRVNGQERAVSANDVAVVEFDASPLAANVQAKVNQGQPFLLLRNGQIVDGQLSDIGGTRPLRLTVDTPSGARDFSSNDVAKVFVNPVPAAPAAAPSPGVPETPNVPAGAIRVPANVQWTETGIAVVRTGAFVFNASGDIMVSPTVSSGVGGNAAVAPGGASSAYPLPGAPVGALIGRVGSGRPFLIGSNTQPIRPGGVGRLMLGVNDNGLEDNSGAFTVTITKPR